MKLFSISAALSLLLFNPALAGQITALNWFSGVGSVAGDFIFPPSAPNNDDVAGSSPNTLLITQKAYFGIGPVDPAGDFIEIRRFAVAEYAAAVFRFDEHPDHFQQFVRTDSRDGVRRVETATDEKLRVVAAQTGNLTHQTRLVLPVAQRS